uniref:Major facilitator superfamily domain-containing protein 8 n=1 Tax=Ascaris suum TaxID=6253 RepID=F1L2W5_ASCSU
MKVHPSIKSADIAGVLDKKGTPWRSLWISYLVQMMTGIQYSIYFTSMWPYLVTLDSNVNLSMFGWITVAYSIGQMFATWVFGYWNQRTMSVRWPACCGLAFMTFGNAIYGALSKLPVHHAWWMLFARLLVGFGSGNLTVLRTYCAMASSRQDRSKAMSLAAGAFVVGLSLGPALQSLFTPIGKKGVVLLALPLNMYTTPAFLMIFISLLSLHLLVVVFEEVYAGIITDDEKRDAFVVVPKFDRIAAAICVYLWFMMQSISTNVEIISTPFAMALYNWNEKEAVFYNGIMQWLGCCIDVINYIIISITPVGKIDKRKLLIFSVLCFMLHHILTFPWPFYDGPLDYIPTADSGVDDTSISGGCLHRYEWCAHTTRVPLPIYAFSVVVISGFAFPFLAAPLGTVFSEILGPRKQGMMQGVFEFGGSFARCIAPIILTILFEASGYLWPTVIHFLMLLIGLVFLLVFYRRIVPLKLIPERGVPTHYRNGVFYRL